MLLVRSINEFPHPIAYKTHQVGLKMVKDLTVARRFIMRKLVVGMLNMVDQFPFNVCDDDDTISFFPLLFLQSLFLSLIYIYIYIHSLFKWRVFQYIQALTETARDMKVWKEFAMEASRCNGYADFGRMLLKLHNVNSNS